MKLTAYLKLERLRVALNATTGEALLSAMVEALVIDGVALDVGSVVDVLLEREYTCSTGVGHWLGIPHATIDGLSETVMSVATIEEPLAFNAIDGQPIKLAFLLLSPPERASEHLRLLARIARICADEQFIDRLWQVAVADELYRMLCEEDGRHVG